MANGNGNGSIWKTATTLLAGSTIGLGVAVWESSSARAELKSTMMRDYLTSEEFERRLPKEAPYVYDRKSLLAIPERVSRVEARMETMEDEIRKVRTKLERAPWK